MNALETMISWRLNVENSAVITGDKIFVFLVENHQNFDSGTKFGQIIFKIFTLFI